MRVGYPDAAGRRGPLRGVGGPGAGRTSRLGAGRDEERGGADRALSTARSAQPPGPVSRGAAHAAGQRLFVSSRRTRSRCTARRSNAWRARTRSGCGASWRTPWRTRSRIISGSPTSASSRSTRTDGVVLRWRRRRALHAARDRRGGGMPRVGRRAGGVRGRPRRRGGGGGGQRPRAAAAIPPRTPRSWRCARPPRALGSWRLDGCTLYVTLGAVRDVRGGHRARPGRPGGGRRGRPQGRVRRIAREPAAGRPSEPSRRAHDRGAGRGVRRAARRRSSGRGDDAGWAGFAPAARLLPGGVPERTNGTASKAVRGLKNPSRVQITPPPRKIVGTLTNATGAHHAVRTRCV